MEKYAVDLDKVLDELEFNEDRAEQLASTLNKRTANGTTPHIGYGPVTRKASAPSMHYRRPTFEPINLADADFAAAPQPSASYVESSYTPQAIAHGEGRHPGSHWQQNGVSAPRIGNMLSSLNEFVGDNKTDLKNHPSLWIQKNLADSRNTSKGKTEKRNGSLGVFISNVTLNSGGHVSECNTTDSLYYNEINKPGASGGENLMSHKQDIKIKRNNVATEVPGSRPYEEYLSKSVSKSKLISGTPSINCEPYRTDGLECQTSESSVLGVDISCESEGLECNSSNPCEEKEQSVVGGTSVTESNCSETEILGVAEISKSVDLNGSTIDSHNTGHERKFLPGNADEIMVKEQRELVTDGSNISDYETATSKNIAENVRDENNVIGEVIPAISFSSFVDISDEELQQYLQDLEEEIGNETVNVSVTAAIGQESAASDSSVDDTCRHVPRAEVDTRINHSENDVDLGEQASSSNGGNISRAAEVQDTPEASMASDAALVVTSDTSMTPIDSGPPPTTTPASVPGPTSSLPVAVPAQQTTMSAAAQDVAPVLPHPTLAVPSSATAPLEVLLADEDAKTTQAVPKCDGESLVLSQGNNVSAEIAHPKPLSVITDPVVDNASVTLYVSSTKDSAPAGDESTASCSGATRICSTESHTQPPLSSTFALEHSDMSTVVDLPVDTVKHSSVTAADVSVQNILPGSEIPPQTISSVKEDSDLDKAERTVNNSAVELISETISASPPSYQSVIDSSRCEGFSDRDKYTSQENNPFPRSEVNVSVVRMPKENSVVDVLGEEERPSRPHFLHLPSKINVDDHNSDAMLESPPGMLTYDTVREWSPLQQERVLVPGPPGETPTTNPHLSLSDNLGSEGTVSSPDLSDTSSVEQAPSDSTSDMVSPEDRALGKLPPYWVPDADAPSCMLCSVKFTVLKRRHHCRACGKVLCSKCCNLRFRMEYLDNEEARVCQPCFEVLARVCAVEQCENSSGSPSSAREPSVGMSAALGRRPNPNNPMEYCSTIPPLEQAASTLRQPPPSVLVPVGVLKREGSARSKSDVTKQVMFSDGIRPGGDLTELDGSSEPRMPYRRPGRVLKRVGTPPGVLPVAPPSHSAQNRTQPTMDPKTNSFIPEQGLPPIVTLLNGNVRYEADYESTDKLMAVMKSETELPVVFAINRNYFVQVKIVDLDCCVNRTCWCFSTLGLRCVGQDEVLVVLECLQGETSVPRDVFLHLNSLYQEAAHGVTVGELGYTVAQRTNFLGSLDHGGFIYVRPSFQCLGKLVLPPAPYLFAILVHRWEMPWARLFPIRLMLRLGAEFRYYPCMLVSIRQRKPVYCEIGHTIMNLLADFRNLSYTLPSVRGLVIHMKDRQTSILLPKNRYDQVTRALNNSNDHVLAFAANFSQEADSHLVCIQGAEDESYHTQAINIHTKPRKVTGASFVVFNGALKSSLNLTAKSSIVEDGLMVQISSDDMAALRTALRNMVDFTIGCGPSGAPAPDELVLIKWVDDDKNFNVGVRSCIDGKCLDGVPSIRVHNGTDYVGSSRFIRWTEVFIIQSEDGSGQSGDPLDISRLSESIAQATCVALVQLLDSLAEAGLTMLAVRANIHHDNVGYEAGSGGERLAPVYMNSLDNELVPVLHKAASSGADSPAAILELVFHIMLQ